MKNNLLKFYVFAFLFAGNFVMFAQPGDENGDGNLEDPDPVVPINTKLIWLAIIGISFAFFYYNKSKEGKQFQQ